ncbi:MAG TPA: FHA domain-containing serine/threonine-protein kinase [Anaerolineae bacterium]|nr:protein kinase [Anaerolineae bacterium]MCB0177379.1 protein kinase [Anaerolineae bacterium]MCB0223341.1 protein kinase [Anaerolineae bacterium]MCB9107445.1 protein kinase [Anaerolineales bacterium]HRV93060.1 FHA domain-containing serine/threonine-protein kinase [Anaerolineae bacterium]
MALDLVGKTLGGYRLDRLIGEGGMASVYKGYQESLKRWVAVKVLYYQEGTSLARFQLEAKAIASLRHRNILIIYEYGEEEGLPYIAMEYIEGGTLEERLNGSPLGWRQVVNLSIPIAEALHYAHNHNIIHRDVKPSNILMPQEDWPLLADFGLVKRSDSEQSLTKTGTFLGTPNYIAPEQARDLVLDCRADLYSLGVVMFEMITGRLPFDYEIPNKILLAHVTEMPPSPRDFNPNCPVELEQVILKTLEKDRDDRYPDMQGLIDALEQILANPPAVADEPALPDSSQEKSAGLFGSFKKLFGSKPKRPHEGQGDSTASNPELALAGDENMGTLQLDRADAARPIARIVLKDKSATIDLPNKNTLVLGRTHGNTVVDIDLDPYQASKYGVSRRHARLVSRSNRWLLEDLHSLNGTFVNGVEVKHGQPVELNHKDSIRLSHMVFTFELL